MKLKTKGKVELFPQKGGWHYIRVPKKTVNKILMKATRGLIPITAQINKTSWSTSLLPMGDGTHFIALSAKVRKSENITLGDTITVSFSVR